MEKRVAVIGIVISDRKGAATQVNNILADYGDIIVGRMGLPYQDRGLNIISLIVDGTNDQIGALAGKVGNIHGVKVKSMVTT